MLKHPRSSNGQHAGQPPRTQMSGRSFLSWAFAIGVYFVVFAASCSLSGAALEERLRPLGYHFITDMVGGDTSSIDLPVRVIDLKPLYSELGDGHVIEPENLEPLIKQLTELEQPPRVIAIDVNFGPRGVAEREVIVPAGGIIRTYPQHKRTLSMLRDFARDPDLMVVVGTAFVQGGLTGAFIPDPQTEEERSLANDLAPMAGSLATWSNPRTFPRYFALPDQKLAPIPAFGHRIIEGIAPEPLLKGRIDRNKMLGFVADSFSGEAALRSENVTLDYSFLNDYRDIVYTPILDLDPDSGAFFLELSEDSRSKLSKDSAALMNRQESSDSILGYAVILGQSDDKDSSDIIAIDSLGDSFYPSLARIHPRVTQHVAYVNSVLFRKAIDMPNWLSRIIEVLCAGYLIVLGIVRTSQEPDLKSPAARALKVASMVHMCLGWAGFVGVTLLIFKVAGVQGISSKSVLFSTLASAAIAMAVFLAQALLPSSRIAAVDKCQKACAFLRIKFELVGYLAREGSERVSQMGNLVFVVLVCWVIAELTGLYWSGFVTVMIFVLLEELVRPVSQFFERTALHFRADVGKDGA